jgi:adenosylhomocysteine nucleosidase
LRDADQMRTLSERRYLVQMVLIFHAFGRELAPLRKKLERHWRLAAKNLNGFGGAIAGIEFAAVATGIGPASARDIAARSLAAYSDIDLILTTGVAGALSPNLAVGDIVIANRFILDRADTEGGNAVLEVDNSRVEAVQHLLNASGFAVSAGGLLTSPGVVGTPEAKREARRRHGAIAVDMESAAVAFAARESDAPVVCIRAIMDPAEEHVLDGGISSDGRIKPLKAAGSLIRKPSSILRVPRLLRNLTLASRTLAEAIVTIFNHLN